MPKSVPQAADRITRPRRIQWACWQTRGDFPAQIVSFYVDLNVEGIFLGGGLGHFEGYVNLLFRFPSSTEKKGS